MPINILNSFGPISFESSTLNFSSGSSINSLLENFLSVGVQDFSISSSLSEISKRKGNFLNETGVNNEIVGTSLSNYNNNGEIRFSSFFNATYLSASITQENDGVVTIDTYSPSTLINNNFFTGNARDQVFKYSLYTKTGVVTPITDDNWSKIYSFTTNGNNYYKFYGLVDTNSYKVTVQDCVTNAFTSSLFIGNCTDTVNTQDSYTFNILAPTFESAISLIKNQVINAINLNLDQKLDLLNNILNNLYSIIIDTKLFKTSDSLNAVLQYRDSTGYQRVAKFTGLVYQKADKYYVFNGSVRAYSLQGNISDYYYSFDDVDTRGKITLHILGKNTKTGANCESNPTRVGNIPTNVFVRGPICGELDCGANKTQPICNPIYYTQVRHSSSFVLTNENDHDLTVSISNDPNDWTDLNGNVINELLTPINFYLSTPLVIPAKSFKKVSVNFGDDNYLNQDQPTNFTVKSKINFSLPDGFNYEPRVRESEIKISFDKNLCLIGVKSPYLISQASNIGNVNYTGLSGEGWDVIKTKIKNSVSTAYGVFSDKLYGNGIISSLPLTGCDLPTSIVQQNTNLTLNWTLITSSPPQSFICSDQQFGGTYNVTVNNTTYGTSNFYIYFLRKNDNSLGAYINLTQLGGTSNPF